MVDQQMIFNDELGQPHIITWSSYEAGQAWLYMWRQVGEHPGEADRNSATRGVMNRDSFPGHWGSYQGALDALALIRAPGWVPLRIPAHS